MIALVLSGLLAIVRPADFQHAHGCVRPPYGLGDAITTGTLDGSTSIIGIRTLVDRSGTVIAWVYLGDNGMHYLQPSEAISRTDAALLKVNKPAGKAIGKISAAQLIPPLPDASLRRCATKAAV